MKTNISLILILSFLIGIGLSIGWTKNLPGVINSTLPAAIMLGYLVKDALRDD